MDAGGSTLKDDPVANAFINELFDSEYVDLGIDGSTIDVPVVNDSSNDVDVDVLDAPNGIVDVVPLQVVPSTVLVDSSSVPVATIPTSSVVDSAGVATSQVVAATVAFIAGAIGEPTNPFWLSLMNGSLVANMVLIWCA
ncbi:hypothetical protein V6N13_072851 [Hibiscus sabdariffa]|uniref:Uncharacterized protein n=1 Tax=Hibiscus sabdariffa TaxID=183260 RepID=A0ABR2E8V5_9ROSI